MELTSLALLQWYGIVRRVLDFLHPSGPLLNVDTADELACRLLLARGQSSLHHYSTSFVTYMYWYTPVPYRVPYTTVRRVDSRARLQGRNIRL